jgi:hypothetical protein
MVMVIVLDLGTLIVLAPVALELTLDPEPGRGVFIVSHDESDSLRRGRGEHAAGLHASQIRVQLLKPSLARDSNSFPRFPGLEDAGSIVILSSA